MIRWLAVCWLFLPSVALAQQAEKETKPLPPDQAAATMKLPPGFKATLFAGEPDLVQPMAFTFDDRGRVWVVECLSYPTWKEPGPGVKGHDRVTIFEDTDRDGKHDKRTVFYEQGLNLSGIEIGFGGVWLTAVPYLIFIPDANADDKPDGPPKVVLDGWDLKAKHNVVGNLAWGPDGWLYGCNGILSNSLVGKPGAPARERVAINCGVWRYHPVRHTFEAYAHGTTNPWGIDWDEHGQMFITNCVIKHLFHVPQGARFERMFGQDINPHSHSLMESCADHQHWAGGHWTTSRRGEAGSYAAHSDAGGGHAHSGCMIYLGDNWPAEYRGNVFTLNIHGQRLNQDILAVQGGGYIAHHGQDMAFSQDPWFRGVGVKYGPDGGVFISDWSDTGECHDYTEQDCDKSGGRIFKLMYSANETLESALLGAVDAKFDLSRNSSNELLALQSHTNEWHVRHARRLLQERAAAGKLDEAIVAKLKSQAVTKAEPEPPLDERGAKTIGSLRAVQTLRAIGRLDDETLTALVDHPDPHVAGQAILAAVDGRKPPPAILPILAIKARQLGSRGPTLHMHLASALPRLPPADAWPLIRALVERRADHNQTLMYWYALEPLVASDPRQAIAALPDVGIPLIRQFMTRRLVAVHEGDGQPNASNAWVIDELMKTLVASKLPAKEADALREDVLTGLLDVYRGRRKVEPPPGWSSLKEALLVKRSIGRPSELAGALGVVYGDRDVIRRQMSVVGTRSAPLEMRVRAAELLSGRREPEFVPLLIGLLEDEAFRPHAIRALGAYDDPRIPPRLLGQYVNFAPAERQDVIQTLTARPAFALALLDAIEQKTIARQDVSALVIRQLQALEDRAVSERLEKVWGQVRPASADKKTRIAQFKEQLSAQTLKLADLGRGRAIFAKTCASCHKLFDEGGRVGPELTGSQRANLDYVLDNVLDPSAIVPREYRANVLRLADGRVVQGVIAEEMPQIVVVQTPNETIRVPTGDIESRKESGLSMMPEGLFDRLSGEEIRDLVGYLASPQQVPLPAGSGQ
jgi:putative membrane-bound dehydrogenase-like protein